MVLVDTCVWSTALRHKRKTNDTLPEEVILLKRLIQQRRAVIIGAILQEVLTGIREDKQFNKLKDQLSAFDLLPLQQENYIEAAHLSNTCRAKGIQGSHTDFLICAAAIHHQVPILTTDKDFTHYAKNLPLKIFLN